MKRLAAWCVGCGVIVATVCLAADSDDSLRVVRVARAELQLRFDAKFSDEQRSTLAAWVERRGTIVAQFYGGFPVQRVAINLQAVNGGGVRGGTTYPGSRPFIRLRVGRDFTVQQLDGDWVLVHEMIHLALPYVGEDHAWLSEGLATYVESLARAQMGDMQRDQLWGDFVKSMSQGLPKADDRGLDNTHTWGRTYWGGALFCLLADIEIRKRSDNRFGLRDALRAILKESGGFTAEWPASKIFRVGDAAIEQHTLSELYAQMKDKPITTDLDALWKQLGIAVDGSTIQFDDRALLAKVRNGIDSSGNASRAN